MMTLKEKWARLCEEYAEADRELSEAWGVIARKIGEVTTDMPAEIVSRDEHERLDAARRKVADINARVDAFIQSHVPQQ